MQDPFNPITHPVTSRRKRNSLSAEPNSTDDQHHYKSTGIPTNKTNDSTFEDHYEKYDVEAVEIEAGNDTTTGDDSEYYDDLSEDTSEDIDKVYTAADYRISKPNDLSTARWSLFKGIEMLAERCVTPDTFAKTHLRICHVLGVAWREDLACYEVYVNRQMLRFLLGVEY